jgi:hypothetical protein
LPVFLKKLTRITGQFKELDGVKKEKRTELSLFVIARIEVFSLVIELL